MLIVLEGLDGAGKATQTKILSKRLKREGYKSAVFDFPQYRSFFGKSVAKYLRGEFGKTEKVDSYFASLLYALDRWTVVEKIRKWQEERIIILCNRYTTANQIYQAAKIRTLKEKEKFLYWLERVEYGFLKIPRPDLVLYLDVPYFLGQRLVSHKRTRRYLQGAKKDIHEKNRLYLQRVQMTAEWLAKKYHWRKIECVKNNKILPKKEIAEKIWQVVNQNLKLT